MSPSVGLKRNITRRSPLCAMQLPMFENNWVLPSIFTALRKFYSCAIKLKNKAYAWTSYWPKSNTNGKVTKGQKMRMKDELEMRRPAFHPSSRILHHCL